MIGAALGYRVKLCMPAQRQRGAQADPARLRRGARPDRPWRGHGRRDPRGAAARSPRTPSATSTPTSTPTRPTGGPTTNARPPEIWEQTGGRDHALRRRSRHERHVHRHRPRRLKELNPAIRWSRVEPDSPVPRPRGDEAHGDAPSCRRIYDPTIADENRGIATEEAYEMVKRVAREEGILVGISAGAAVATALEVAREIESGDGRHRPVRRRPTSTSQRLLGGLGRCR